MVYNDFFGILQIRNYIFKKSAAVINNLSLRSFLTLYLRQMVIPDHRSSHPVRHRAVPLRHCRRPSSQIHQ